MLTPINPRNYRAFGYRFQDGPIVPAAQLHGVGCDLKHWPHYRWSGKERTEKDLFIMQYTIAGEGRLEMGGVVHRLEPYHAFFVEVDDDYVYYAPESDTGWEFIYVMLQGEHARAAWAYISEQLGPVAFFEPDSVLIRQLFAMYRDAADSRIADAYQGAAAAYAFVMELFRAVRYANQAQESRTETIRRTIDYIRANYRCLTGLEELAENAGVSKYHFARLFREGTGKTPFQYVTKVRLEASVELLRGSTLTIEQIAREIGYANGNYFIRLFREWTGMSPGEFRQGKHIASFDHLTID